jgi:hypothetical protein
LTLRGIPVRVVWNRSCFPITAPLLPSLATGVGSEKPKTVALMGCANVGSSQHCPAAVIPERGQVTQDSLESANKERWAVLHEREGWSNLANDPRHVGPEAAARAVEARTLTGDADVLAREAASDHVNSAAPWPSVKGSHVIPYRERREKAVVLAGDENARGVGVKFDGADGMPSEQLAAEYAATSARE